jgi:hypothetical protein
MANLHTAPIDFAQEYYKERFMNRAWLLAIVLLSAATSSALAQDYLKSGEHSLSATFDKADQTRNLFHDVRVRLKSSKVTLLVVEDIVSGADEKPLPAKKTAQSTGFGGFRGGTHPDWRRRPEGQKPWLPRGRKLHGKIENDEDVRFGFTCVRDGELVSLHFVGRPTANGATGKVYRLSAGKPAEEGTWELYNPQPNALPFGTSLKGVSREEALELNQEALQLSLEVHGREHPTTISMMRGLVNTYSVIHDSEAYLYRRLARRTVVSETWRDGA